MKHRNKGFTLVEIVVSIALGSVVLAILGTMILTSSNFLSGTSDSDLDKRCVDSCVEFVRDQIEYSTDVRIIENKGLDNYPVEGEDNWHCFYIKNHILYRDDSPVFDDSFYNHKQLEILVKDDYKNNMRVDFTYHLNDSDGEKAYGNRDTIVFLNITEKVNNEQGLYVSENVSLDANKSFSKKGNYAIYYKKSLKTNHSSDKPSGGNDYIKSGTVADLIFNLNYDNSRGYFNSSFHYNKGDYVYYDGYWWMKNAKNDSPAKPGESGSAWERIDKNYRVGENSSYLKDDIVVYNGQYYKCVTDNYAWTNPELCKNPPVSKDDNQYNYQWEKITEQEAKSKEYEKVYSYNENMVIKRYLPSDIKVSDVNPNSIALYDSNKVYTVGDIVKLELNNTGYYLKYYKAFNANTSGLAPGVVPENGWILIENDYYSTSAYAVGDYVIGNNGGLHNDRFVFYVPKYNYVDNLENTLNLLKSINQYTNYETPYSYYFRIYNNDSTYINKFWTIINGW